MHIPLHLSPDDDSPAAATARFEHAVEAAQLNPQGFRRPGRRGTSLVIRLGVAAGMMDDHPEPSARGAKKRAARARHVENVLAQQLAEREAREAAARILARALGARQGRADLDDATHREGVARRDNQGVAR